MNTIKTDIEGVLLINLKIYKDNRGFFLEKYQFERYSENGIKDIFVQDNHSRSYKNVLRGIHYQKINPQSQLLTLISGSIFDVLVDLRKNSKTFKKWISIYINEDSDIRQIYMPPGVAHGFCVLSNTSDLHYKVSKKYDSNTEGGLIWNDNTLNIDWPLRNPILSKQDSLFPSFTELEESDFPDI